MNKEQLPLEIDRIYSEYHGFDLGLLDEKSENLIKEGTEKLLNLHVVGSSFKLGQKVYSAWRDNELIIEAVGFDGCYLRDNEDGEVEWHDDSEIHLH